MPDSMTSMLGRTIQGMLAKQDYFNKLSRYQCALARDFERNLDLFRRLKGDARRHSVVGQVGESSVSTSPTAKASQKPILGPSRAASLRFSDRRAANEQNSSQLPAVGNSRWAASPALSESENCGGASR